MCGLVQRRDPADGALCTLQELEQKYAAEKTTAEIHRYWRNLTSQKTVLVIRHGEGQHQLKKAKNVDKSLGPVLTPKGKLQADEAKQKVAKLLRALQEEQALIVTSNLVRAVETALRVAPADSEVIVQPLVRERIANQHDEPSELDSLSRWAADQLVEMEDGRRLSLDLYEQEVQDSDHAAYIQRCWEEDCVPRVKGSSPASGCSGWTDKENKENLQARAHKLVKWLEELPAQLIILVSHGAFIQRVTADKDYMDNCEVRAYRLHKQEFFRDKELERRQTERDGEQPGQAGHALLRPRGSVALFPVKASQ